ncbi:hypothetical protein BDK51DRAFT_41426 [Blyttiomyces helicus]|uniref:Uncharacterized protein n=1 Tax=Blyttiomyces helicus TaxID=388810 RepID=A0A4V1IPI1_9FUNG|nr:hypothetical protein BDK51DRAFT_41426 [Blyttiomyces helicus]|eukprot:RKO83137.1 hypothetical protein BDK51DRAFT_41426 [Blyttiomyces helicus]
MPKIRVAPLIISDQVSRIQGGGGGAASISGARIPIASWGVAYDCPSRARGTCHDLCRARDPSPSRRGPYPSRARGSSPDHGPLFLLALLGVLLLTLVLQCSSSSNTPARSQSRPRTPIPPVPATLPYLDLERFRPVRSLTRDLLRLRSSLGDLDRLLSRDRVRDLRRLSRDGRSGLGKHHRGARRSANRVTQTRKGRPHGSFGDPQSVHASPCQPKKNANVPMVRDRLRSNIAGEPRTTFLTSFSFSAVPVALLGGAFTVAHAVPHALPSLDRERFRKLVRLPLSLGDIDRTLSRDNACDLCFSRERSRPLAPSNAASTYSTIAITAGWAADIARLEFLTASRPISCDCTRVAGPMIARGSVFVSGSPGLDGEPTLTSSGWSK